MPQMGNQTLARIARRGMRIVPLAHGARRGRAIQMIVKLICRTDAELLGGPIKWGHDKFVFWLV